jgi:endonuclease/exonuclease/phosphatase (EEP) superfamily protein YafD
MPKVGVLFWNMGKRADAQCVAAIAADLRPDIVILAENATSSITVIEALNDATGTVFQLPNLRSGRLHFFANAALPIGSVHDGAGVAIRHVRPVVGQDFLIVGVHLASKLHLSDNEQASLINRLGSRIAEAECRVGHSRTIVIGDFNMNPFEHGVVGSEGLHATMSKVVATRGTRTVLGEDRRFFYNPMWSFLGDMSGGPPGTFFFRASGPIAYFWHMFDQVLLRPEMAEGLGRDDILIVTSAGARTLLNQRGRPDETISDHLPLFVKLTIKENLNFEKSVG